ncbi:hypothetical protein BH11MYX2_BH11MYX2_10100 [soil metagenome]
MADTFDDSGPFKWPMLITVYTAMTVGLIMLIAVLLM